MFKEFHCITISVEYYDVVRSVISRYAEGDYPIKHKRGEYCASILAKFKERKWNKLIHDMMLLDEWHEDLGLRIDY